MTHTDERFVDGPMLFTVGNLFAALTNQTKIHIGCVINSMYRGYRELQATGILDATVGPCLVRDM
jgi:hypothetical protein